jgi:hypothetical protein
MESADVRDQSGVKFRQRLDSTGNPVQQGGLSGVFQQVLEKGKIGVAHPGQFGIGEATEDEVHLAGATMPGAKKRPPPAGVQFEVGSCRSGHAKGLCSWARHRNKHVVHRSAHEGT